MNTTPDGIPLHNSICTCSVHCANACESGHCSGWCNCWCHEKKYAKLNRAIRGLAKGDKKMRYGYGKELEMIGRECQALAPHEFVGRSDRWCEVCNRPDRDTIHTKGPVHYPVTGLGFVTKEWANLFLELGWRVTVYMWDEGRLFSEDSPSHLGWNRQAAQEHYAEVCCAWLIPNGFQEPHVVAEGG